MEKELKASCEEIDAIRLQDRRAQGVTHQDELDAWEIVRKAQPKGSLWKVQVPGRAHSAYGDLLYTARRAREWLLQSKDVWTYSGPAHRQLMALALPEQHWSGGTEAAGFFGIKNPSEQSQQEIINLVDP